MAWIGVSLMAAVALAAQGCGGGGKDCGAGTVAMDGECVPESELACGDGTVMMDGECVPKSEIECGTGTTMTDGECVPDGSMICSGATTYDMESGACVLDESACAAGTVLQDGTCVPFDDTLEGDVEEGEEPNGIEPGTQPMPTMFTLPEAGADPISMKGCVQPQDFDGDEQKDIDLDGYSFSVSQPTLINVRVDGIGGLSGAFRVVSLDAELTQDGWGRIGADLTSDESERQVFLPTGGDYVILAGDGRSVLLNEPAGGEETCYYMEVTHLEIPEATELTLGETETGMLGDPMFFSTTSSEAQVLASQLAVDSSSAQGALVHLVDNSYSQSAAAAGGQLTLREADLPADGTVMVVVDHTFNISLDPVPYQLTVRDPQGKQMPEDGDVTLTHSSEAASFVRFHGESGELVHVEFDGGAGSFALEVLDPDGQVIGQPSCFGGPCSSTDFWLQLTKTGTHYVGLSHTGAEDGDEYTANFVRTHMTPTELSLGDTYTADMSSADRTFFSYSTGSADWAEFLYDNFGGGLDDPEIQVYFRDQAGVIDGSVGNVSSAFTETPADGDTVEHIYAGLNYEFLLSVQETETHDGDESLDLTFRDADYTDLGMLDSETSVDLTGESVAAGESNRYFARGAQSAMFEAMATLSTGSGLDVETLDLLTESVQTAAEGETLSTRVSRSEWVAYRISGASEDAASYDFSINVTDPMYTVERNTEGEFTNVCPSVGGSGEMHALTGSDDGISQMSYMFESFGFQFFGEAVDGITVSSNGWLTFDTEYSGSSVPSAGSGIASSTVPNQYVAPFWRNLQDAYVCIAESADELTVQWLGDTRIATLFFGTFEEYVQFEAVLHSDGTIEVVYGPGHVADGSRKGFIDPGGLVGIENAEGSNGLTSPTPVAAGDVIRFAPTM